MGDYAMKKLVFALAAVSLAVGSGAQAATPGVSKGEARLAKMLEGRVAGEPESCISGYRSNRLEVIDETAVVYDAGSTIWVARPTDPRSLDDRDVLVIERFGGQLCAQDVIRTIDSSTGITTGIVFLEDFVPYRKG